MMAKLLCCALAKSYETVQMNVNGLKPGQRALSMMVGPVYHFLKKHSLSVH